MLWIYTCWKVKSLFYFYSQQYHSTFLCFCQHHKCQGVIMFNIWTVHWTVQIFYFKLALLLVEMDTDSDRRALDVDPENDADPRGSGSTTLYSINWYFQSNFSSFRSSRCTVVSCVIFLNKSQTNAMANYAWMTVGMKGGIRTQDCPSEPVFIKAICSKKLILKLIRFQGNSPGLEKTRVLKKKPSPVVFFLFFCPDERVYRAFFSFTNTFRCIQTLNYNHSY